MVHRGGEAEVRRDSLRQIFAGTVIVMVVLSCSFICIISFSSEPAQAGLWGPRVLVTEDNDNYPSTHSSVASDILGNIHVVWHDASGFGGSGSDTDIYLKKWNSTTKEWEAQVLITSDNLNNTDSSHQPDVVTDIHGNVYVAWSQYGDIDGSGWDYDIFWKIWYVINNTWGPRMLITDNVNDTLPSYSPNLAADSFGNVHLAWRQGFTLPEPHSRIQHLKWNGTTSTWGERTSVFNTTGLFWQDMDADLYGNAHFIWMDLSNILGASSGGDDYDIFYRRLDAVSNTLGPVIHVNDDDESDLDSSYIGDVTPDALGNVHIVWDDRGEQSGSGGDNDVFYRKWNATTGNFESRVLISNDPMNTEGSYRPRISPDPMGNLHVVWMDESDVDGAGPACTDLFYKMWNFSTGSWGNTISLTNDLLDGYWVSEPNVVSDSLGNVSVTWVDASGLLGGGGMDVYVRMFESGIIFPDYMPVDVSPPIDNQVLVGSSNLISARTYNGGEVSALTSTMAFYESGSPGSPFYIGNIPPLGRGERSSLHQQLWTAPMTPGTHEISIEVDYGDAITEVAEENNIFKITFEVVLSSPPPRPPPPTNLTTAVLDVDHILLNWTALESPYLDHYLIYRSPDQRGFDFSTSIYDTSRDINPLRTNWTDVNAAGPTAQREYYYTVRAVDIFGNMSTTSNTAGKWTKRFPPGLNTFALPLEPFVFRNISWYADSIPNALLIRWMNSTGHWVTHRGGMGEGINDIAVEMGRGYEILFGSDSSFTFCGLPASMIRFSEGLGDSIGFRSSLSAQKDGSNVLLTWSSAPGAVEYKIMRSTTRIGLHDMSLQPIGSVLSGSVAWTDLNALSEEGEYYYMIIPVDINGNWGSSTYGIGVITKGYERGSDTLSPPLEQVETRRLDWYCDNIPNVVGMAYLISGVWKFHIRIMPEGVYDTDVVQGEGYQISIDFARTRFTFVGY